MMKNAGKKGCTPQKGNGIPFLCRIYKIQEIQKSPLTVIEGSDIILNVETNCFTEGRGKWHTVVMIQ
jgi:hypothetical protein